MAHILDNRHATGMLHSWTLKFSWLGYVQLVIWYQKIWLLRKMISSDCPLLDSDIWSAVIKYCLVANIQFSCLLTVDQLMSNFYCIMSSLWFYSKISLLGGMVIRGMIQLIVKIDIDILSADKYCLVAKIVR